MTPWRLAASPIGAPSIPAAVRRRPTTELHGYASASATESPFSSSTGSETPTLRERSASSNAARPVQHLGRHPAVAGPQYELPKFTLPESTIKKILAVSRIAETQQAMVSRLIKPFASAAVRAEAVRRYQQRHLSCSPVQPNLNLLAPQRAKNIDFSVFAGAARVAGQFAAQQATWLKNIVPAFASIRAAFYPPNLRSVEGLEFGEVEQVVMAGGIPLYGLPRSSIAEALVQTDGTRGR